MRITIRKPLAFSEIGRKDNQEDALYPNPSTVTTGQRVFLMCDGMGGHEHGEVASQTVSEVMGCILTLSSDPRADFEKALSAAYDALDAKDSNDGGKKMGTTMTCLILDPKGALVAHIGDSRVYQIRPESGLKLQTSDHSLVNDLLKAGELTEEEARDYPHKNIITRAMQPHQEKRSKADISLQNDIKAGDFFFLCCDGVLEQLTNQRLCEILSIPGLSDQERIDLIKAECYGKTKDNFTCWLIPIDSVELDDDDVATDDSDVIKADVMTEETDSIVVSEDKEDTSEETEKPQGFFSKLKLIFECLIAIVVAGSIGWYSMGIKNADIDKNAAFLDKCSAFFSSFSSSKSSEVTKNSTEDSMPDAPKDESIDTNGSDTSEGIEINADSIGSK